MHERSRHLCRSELHQLAYPSSAAAGGCEDALVPRPLRAGRSSRTDDVLLEDRRRRDCPASRAESLPSPTRRRQRPQPSTASPTLRLRRYSPSSPSTSASAPPCPPLTPPHSTRSTGAPASLPLLTLSAAASTPAGTGREGGESRPDGAVVWGEPSSGVLGSVSVRMTWERIMGSTWMAGNE